MEFTQTIGNNVTRKLSRAGNILKGQSDEAKLFANSKLAVPINVSVLPSQSFSNSVQPFSYRKLKEENERMTLELKGNTLKLNDLESEIIRLRKSGKTRVSPDGSPLIAFWDNFIDGNLSVESEMSDKKNINGKICRTISKSLQNETIDLSEKRITRSAPPIGFKYDRQPLFKYAPSKLIKSSPKVKVTLDDKSKSPNNISKSENRNSSDKTPSRQISSTTQIDSRFKVNSIPEFAASCSDVLNEITGREILTRYSNFTTTWSDSLKILQLPCIFMNG